MMRIGILGAGDIGRRLSLLVVNSAYTLDWAVDPRFVDEPIVGSPIRISKSPPSLDVDVIIQSTTSSMVVAAEQLEGPVSAGVHIVSSCEEMAFPLDANVDVAEALHKKAANSGSVVVGAGVNPGFVMDALPAFLMASQTDVRRIACTRIVDLNSRRPALQEKICIGKPISEAQEEFRAGRAGHRGLRESGHLLASTLRGEVTHEEYACDAIDREGRCVGMEQSLRLKTDGGVEIELHLEMSILAEASHDSIVVEGDPGLRLEIPDGLAGDAATAARLLNVIPSLASMKSGLRSVLDLPVGGTVGDVPRGL